MDLAQRSTLIIVALAAATFAGGPRAHALDRAAIAIIDSTKLPFTQRKSDVMAKMKSALDVELRLLASLDEQIKRTLVESHEILLKESGRGSLEGAPRVARLTETVEDLQKKRDERVARRQAYEQLISKVDAKWTGQPFKEFLEQQIVEMSTIDAVDQAGHGKAWKFYAYLSIALREIADNREDPIDFIFAYVDFSTILNPRSPIAYMGDRSFSNGMQSSSAKPMTPEKAADETDRRLRELGLLSRAAPPSRSKTERALRQSKADVSTKYPRQPEKPRSEKSDAGEAKQR